MEVFTYGMRKLWKEWQMRVLVLLSLTLQIVLIILGNRRKHTSKTWMGIVLWCAYLMADSVATVALGVISNNLGDANDEKGFMDAGTEISAFWAPLLLLHLGGPDTITAYSLEDNELWPRHFLGLGVQIAVTLYIFLLAWNWSALSIMSIPMFCAGIIKYSERTWVLRSASNKQFKASMLTRRNVIYPNFTSEYAFKQCEGFHVRIDEINKELVPVNPEKNYFIDVAHYLFQNFKRLFVELALNFDDWYNSRLLFKEISYDQAFKVIEIELGFMYDVLYTKATVIHSRKGWAFRLISFSLTCAVLVFFSMIYKHKYPKIDLVVTFLLLSVAVVLEVYALVLILSSDWTRLWLSEQRKTPITRVLTCLQLPKHHRWSNSISQFNLLSFSLNKKRKRIPFYRIQKLLRIDKVVEKYLYTTQEEVTEDLKKLIFQHLKEKFQRLKELSGPGELISLCFERGGQALEKYVFSEMESFREVLGWSINIEFNQSILIWHIATDICYHVDSPEYYINCELSQLLSQYMLYILVVCPFKLLDVSELMRFHDTCADVRKFCEGHNLDKPELCKKLLENKKTEVPSYEKLKDTSTSVLRDACKLASQLQDIPDKDQKWEMISNVWVEMLAYASGQLTGKTHAEQLKSGGEFLTHVWLLMAHFGLNKLFDISEGYGRANQLIVE